MAEDSFVVKADVTQFVTEMNKVADALERINASETKLIEQQAKLNAATGEVQQIFTQVSKENEQVAIGFEKIGRSWQVINQNATVLTSNLKDINVNIDTIAASAVKSALALGDFKTAMLAAQTIQTPKKQAAAIATIEAEQVRQPADTQSLVRNLRRGYEAEVRGMRAESQLTYKQMELDLAQTAARMGITWQELKTQIATVKAGDVKLISDEAKAKLQDQVIAYVNATTQMDAAIQKRVAAEKQSAIDIELALQRELKARTEAAQRIMAVQRELLAEQEKIATTRKQSETAAQLQTQLRQPVLAVAQAAGLPESQIANKKAFEVATRALADFAAKYNLTLKDIETESARFAREGFRAFSPDTQAVQARLQELVSAYREASAKAVTSINSVRDALVRSTAVGQERDIFKNLQAALTRQVPADLAGQLPVKDVTRFETAAGKLAEVGAKYKLTIEQIIAEMQRFDQQNFKFFNPKFDPVKAELQAAVMAYRDAATQISGSIKSIQDLQMQGARATTTAQLLPTLRQPVAGKFEADIDLAKKIKFEEAAGKLAMFGAQYGLTIDKILGEVQRFEKESYKFYHPETEAVQRELQTLVADYSNALGKIKAQLKAFEDADAKFQQKAAGGQRLSNAQLAFKQYQDQIAAGILKQVSETTKWDAATNRTVTTLTAVNRAGNEFVYTLKKIGEELENVQTETSNVSATTRGLTLSWMNFIKLGVYQIAREGFNAITNGIRQSVTAARDLQIQVAQIQTISESGFNVTQWVEGITAVSNATGLLASDVASGLYDTLSNQIADGGKALEFLTTAGKFAIATNATMKDSINAISSALNSYGYGVDQATRVSDVFFRMIDLGRIQAKDFANEIGRIYPLAAQLGVSIEEVSAILSTLTRAGVTPAAAMTSLFNIMSRLIKPAGEMKEFIAGLGVQSSQAAIQMLGFADLLGKITEFTKGRPEITAQLFPDIRGLRAMARLATESGFKEVTKDLEAMSDAAGSVNKAIEYFNENPGKQLQIQLNKIQNYFTQTWGQSLVRAIMYVSNNLVSLTTVAKVAGDALIFLGGPLVIGGLYALGKQITAVRLAFSSLSSGALPWLAAIAAALIVTKVAIDAYTDSIIENGRKSEEAYKQALASAKKLTEEALKPLDKAINENTKALRLYAAELVKSFDKVEKRLVDDAEKTNEVFKELHDSYKQYIDNQLKNTRQNLSNVESEIKKLVSLGAELEKQSRDIKLAAALKEAGEDPTKKIQILLKEYAKFVMQLQEAPTADVIKEATKGALDVIKEIEKIQEDTAKENEERDKKRTDAVKKIAEIERDIRNTTKKANIKEVDDRIKINNLMTAGKKSKQLPTFVDGQVQPTTLKTQQFAVKDKFADEQVTEKLIEYNKELQEQQKILKENQRIKTAQDDSLAQSISIIDLANQKRQQLLVKEEAEKVTIQQQVQSLELLNKQIARAFNEIEKFKFEKLFKAEDLPAFDELFIEGTDNIKEYRKLVLETTKTDFKNRAALLMQIDAMERQFIDARTAYIKKQQAQTAMQLIENLEKELKLRREELANRQNKERQLAIGLAGALEGQITKIGEVAASVQSARTMIQADRPTLGLFGNLQQSIRAIIKTPTEEALLAAKKDFEILKAATVRKPGIFGLDEISLLSPEETAKLDEIFKGLTTEIAKGLVDQANEINKVTTSITNLQTELDKQVSALSTELQFDLKKIRLQEEDITVRKTANEIQKELRDKLVDLKNSLSQQGGAIPTIETIGKVTAPKQEVNVDEVARQLLKDQEARRLLYNQQTTLNKAATDVVQVQETAAQTQVQAAETLQRAANQLEASTLSSDADFSSLMDAFVANLPTKAMGGLMHGSDNIPALLSKGEFVVNAAATRRFYSQLVSMNQFRGYARGGLVTNVGDVNVTLQSTGNTQSDIVAIGKGLQREIRRGRIKF